MVKLWTVGMHKTAKNDPSVIAHADIVNGFIHTKDTNNKTVAPVAGSSSATQTKNLLIALNTIVGDDSYKIDTLIKKDTIVNSYYLKAWDRQQLVFNEDNISYASNTSYDDIKPKRTIMIAHTDGKLRIADGTAIDADDYGVRFCVLKKIQFNGNAVVVKIIINGECEKISGVDALEDELNALTFDVIKDNNTDPDEISDNLDLITESTLYGANITWTSSHPTIIATNGTVTQPTGEDAEDTEVTLTAKVEIDGETGVKKYVLTVLAGS